MPPNSTLKTRVDVQIKKLVLKFAQIHEFSRSLVRVRRVCRRLPERKEAKRGANRRDLGRADRQRGPWVSVRRDGRGEGEFGKFESSRIMQTHSKEGETLRDVDQSRNGSKEEYD